MDQPVTDEVVASPSGDIGQLGQRETRNGQIGQRKLVCHDSNLSLIFVLRQARCPNAIIQETDRV